MFAQYAARAARLSEEQGEVRFTFRYRVRVGETRMVFVEARDQDSAKRKFLDQYPTATILYITGA